MIPFIEGVHNGAMKEQPTAKIYTITNQHKNLFSGTMEKNLYSPWYHEVEKDDNDDDDWSGGDCSWCWTKDVEPYAFNMSMCEYVWVCVSMYEYVWVCMSMHEYAWVCMSMYEYVWVHV